MEIEIELAGATKSKVFQEKDLVDINPSTARRYAMGMLKIKLATELEALRLSYRTMAQCPRLEKLDSGYLVNYRFVPDAISMVRSFAARIKSMEDEMLAPVD